MTASKVWIRVFMVVVPLENVTNTRTYRLLEPYHPQGHSKHLLIVPSMTT